MDTKKTSDLMSSEGDGKNNTLDPKNDDYWGHNNKSCPDMQDSVYFTPTSETPFDPFELACLPKEKWKITKHDYKKYHDRRGATYDCFYGRQDVTVPWEKRTWHIPRKILINNINEKNNFNLLLMFV